MRHGPTTRWKWTRSHLRGLGQLAPAFLYRQARTVCCSTTTLSTDITSDEASQYFWPIITQWTVNLSSGCTAWLRWRVPRDRLCKREYFFFSVPLVAPTNITGHNTSSTSIFVAWQPVSPETKNLRGIHRGYRIYYMPRETSRPSALGNTTVDVHTSEAELVNLYKYTLYDIYLTVRTRWDGPKSGTVTISTDEGSKQYGFYIFIFTA